MLGSCTTSHWSLGLGEDYQSAEGQGEFSEMNPSMTRIASQNRHGVSGKMAEITVIPKGLEDSG